MPWRLGLDGDFLMLRLVLMLMLLIAAPIVAQDSETSERSPTESSKETTDTDSADEINVDEIGESDTYSEADEDDFIPSDDVTYEQSVPFPTDI